MFKSTVSKEKEYTLSIQSPEGIFLGEALERTLTLPVHTNLLLFSNVFLQNKQVCTMHEVMQNSYLNIPSVNSKQTGDSTTKCTSLL